jgi:hypothetical protein
MRALSWALHHTRTDQARARRTDARARFPLTLSLHLTANLTRQMASQTRRLLRPTIAHSTSVTSALYAWSVNPRTRTRAKRKTSASRMAGRTPSPPGLLAHILPLLRPHPTIPNPPPPTIPPPTCPANIPRTSMIPAGQAQTTWKTSSQPLAPRSLISGSTQQTFPLRPSSRPRMNPNRRGREVSTDTELDPRLEEAL